MSDVTNRVEALLGPVVASLDALKVASQRDVSAACQFVEFKLYATVRIGEQIREALQAPAAVLMATPGGAKTIIIDRGARFALYVFVDGFLFESASVRDALLQLVNVAFGLGIAVDDPSMTERIRTHFSVTDTSEIGLEEWIKPSRYPEWFARLITLRNTTTHRHPLRLPVHVTTYFGGNPAPDPPARVTIEREDGEFDPLDEFVTSVEENVTRLLGRSLERLTARLRCT